MLSSYVIPPPRTKDHTKVKTMIATATTITPATTSIIKKNTSSDGGTEMTPSTVPTKTLSLMAEIISYPVLLQHEESFSSNSNTSNTLLYDVSSWMLYITEIDALIDQCNDAISTFNSSKRNKGPLSLSTVNIGGKAIPCQLATLQERLEILYQARNLISERALSLLPGSYKLWKNYLDFKSIVYIQSRSVMFQQLDQNNVKPNDTGSATTTRTLTSYLVTSSTKASKYKSIISAYERSLVRMNKYPRVWTSYIYFCITHNPQPNITSIRQLFNRSLLALPATQHDLIWKEYLCWILNELPPMGLFVEKGKNVDGPLVRACKKNGGVLPNYYSNRMDGGDDDMNDGNDKEEVEEEKDRDDDTIALPSETILRVLRRYAHYYNPTARELLASKALKLGHYGEAATLYCEILNDVDFLSVQGTTRHELWMTLANICTEHPEEINDAGIDFESIIRAVLKPHMSSGGNSSSGFGWDIVDTKKSSENEGEKEDEEEQKQKVIEQRNQLQASLGEMEGTLWTKLAQYHIRMGEFELARSIYEEAMESVMRVRDFSLIFDGYIKFEEGVIEAMMETMNEEEEEEKENGDEKNDDQQSSMEDDEDLDILLGDSAVKRTSRNNDDDEEEDENVSADIELALVRAENVMKRRPLLLNYVLLRQNPHNVGEWLKRADLYLKLDQISQAIASLEESFKAVHSRQAVNGSPADLYKTLASLYEDKKKDFAKARSVYERICCEKPEFHFGDPDDLAQCYTAWVEMELRHEQWDNALSLARRSVAHTRTTNSSKITRGLSRSLRLWNLMLDLEESLGTLQTTKDAYNRLIEIKVATPAHIINFTSYLNGKKYFEESFTAYERGLEMFSFPHPGAKLLWKDYLGAFFTRYGGTKTHRTRELFDRCLQSCPPEDASEFFISYGKFEEEYGLTKRALGIYERMCIVVPAQEKFCSYQLYIAKTIKYLGVTATRPIYEKAISALEDDAAAQMCCDFANMEASMQEIDRARTAFTYGAQLADPRRKPEYWGEWHGFEVSHGNEETFREMLRVKRGVQAAFSTVNYNAAEMGAGAPQQESLTNEEALAMIREREGEEIEERSENNIDGFVPAKRSAEISDLDEVERRAAKLRKVTAQVVNATSNNQFEDEEEINIDGEED